MCCWELRLRWVGLSGSIAHMSFLFWKREITSQADYKQAQGPGLTLIQHCSSDIDIVAGLCCCCFSSLCFQGSNNIHKFWDYTCMYHFNRFIFIEFSFLCDACECRAFFRASFLLYWSNWLLLALIITVSFFNTIIIAYSFLQW